MHDSNSDDNESLVIASVSIVIFTLQVFKLLKQILMCYFNNNHTVPCRLGCIKWAGSVQFSSIEGVFTLRILSYHTGPNCAIMLV